MKNTKWYKSVQLFFERLKPLTWAERIEYIFTYYKELVFTVCFAAVLLFTLLFTALQDRTEVIFGGVFANLDITTQGYEYLTDGVMEILDGDSESQKVALSSTYFKSSEDFSQLDYTYNAAMKPISMIEEGTLDYFVMNEDAMMFYMTQHALMDLRRVFTDEELAQMEDLLVYLEMESDHTRYPVAIKVNSMPFFVDCVEVSEPVYFSFANTDADTKIYHLFWQYLMNWHAEGS